VKGVKPSILAVLLPALLAAGLLARLLFVQVFPTRPISDFRGLVEFGLWMRDHSLTTGGYFWDFFNPGLPVVLSWIFRIFPRDPDTAARLSTAVATGLLPIFPFVLWRGVLPDRVRLLATGMLALWPGQIFFSGVVAQDNWVLLPTVALACLAVRAMSREEGGGGHPVAAGLLYTLGIAFRQEMLVALFPLFVAAALGSSWRARWRRSLLLAVLAAGAPLLLLALQRQAATGRFALSTQHGGVAVLGSYVPGSTVNAWVDPLPYVASVKPSLLDNPGELKRQVPRLALREAAARPLFHTARILAFTLDLVASGDAANVVWSLLYPDVMPPSRGALAQAVAGVAIPWLKVEMGALLALFLASLLLARSGNPAVWALVAAMALKIGFHAVTVMQARYLLASTALQILVIALVLGEVAGKVSRRRVAAALAAGTVAATAMSLSAARAVAWVQARDVDVPRVYRFSLASFPGDPKLFDCVVRQGRLTTVYDIGARMETFHPDPPAGETAAAECVSRAAVPLPPLVIRLLDPYAPGGSPGRMAQRVVVDGREVLVHDVAAEPGSGWSEIPLGATAAGQRRTFRVELRTVQPQPGVAWGRDAGTSFELARAQEKR
jgi:Dolichyl-phosphate-mannose-protein mannosyltransferase